jgi:hypothetical protein
MKHCCRSGAFSFINWILTVFSLSIQSKENFGKILKRNFNFQEGRESSGLRRPVWKKVRLVVELEQEQQNEKYADYVEDSRNAAVPKAI